MTKKICVLGLGYAGLTLSVVMAEAGLKVTGIEKNETVVRDLAEGKVHFYERGLLEALKRCQGEAFTFTSKLDASAVADVYIIAVGTPVGDDKKPRLDDLMSVAKDVGRLLKRGDLVCLRSTVAPTTTREIVKPLLESTSGLKAGIDFYLAFAPERAIEGKALEELKSLPQIVGGINKESVIAAENIFNKFVPRIIAVESLEAAEMIKALNNSYRDLVFAYANEVALICDKFNLDAQEIIKNANAGYERSRIPMPSPGVGGYCLTKDPYILMDAAQKKGFNPKLIPSARDANEFMPKHVFGKIEEFSKKTGKSLSAMKVFILGFAFKGWPETSDMRFSPTLDVLSLLKGKADKVFGFDPIVKADIIQNLGVQYVGYEDGFSGADCVLIMNNHPDFAELDIVDCIKKMNRPALFFDTWRLYDPGLILNIGDIKYCNLGLTKI